MERDEARLQRNAKKNYQEIKAAKSENSKLYRNTNNRLYRNTYSRRPSVNIRRVRG